MSSECCDFADFSTLIENHYFYVDKQPFKGMVDSGDSTALHLKERQCWIVGLIVSKQQREVKMALLFESGE